MAENGPPQDPITVLAEAANHLHELFTAYINAGFTEKQALYIVGQVIQGSFNADSA